MIPIVTIVELIERELRAVPALSMLGRSESSDVLDRVARRFVSDPSQRWWWTSLKVSTHVYSYEEPQFIGTLSQVLRDLKAERVFLIATDDEFSPWPVVVGGVAEILVLLEALPFFEFFVTSEFIDWVLFDTHHNELIFASNGIKSGVAGL